MYSDIQYYKPVLQTWTIIYYDTGWDSLVLSSLQSWQDCLKERILPLGGIFHIEFSKRTWRTWHTQQLTTFWFCVLYYIHSITIYYLHRGQLSNYNYSHLPRNNLLYLHNWRRDEFNNGFSGYRRWRRLTLTQAPLRFWRKVSPPPPFFGGGLTYGELDEY